MTVVSAPWRATCSATPGAARCPQALHHTISRRPLRSPLAGVPPGPCVVDTDDEVLPAPPPVAGGAQAWFGIAGAAPGVDGWGIGRETNMTCESIIGDAALIAAIGLLAAIIVGVV
jgi:hypothetical protein